MEHIGLSGEGRITSEGIFTPVHYYCSNKGLEVILIGTTHEGEACYFQNISTILDLCQWVIYEEPRLDLWEPENRRNNEIRWRELLFSDKLEEAWIGSAKAPLPQGAFDLLGLVLEWTSYDYSKDGWISGDAGWHKQDEEDAKVYWQKFKELSAELPVERRWDLVHRHRAFFQKCDNGTLTRTDFIMAAINSWTDKALLELHHKLWTGERDEETFGIFDDVVRTKTLQRVGIKFGAAHTAYQRKLLENRGYVFKQSQWLKAVSVP